MLRGSGRWPRTRPCPPASATAEEADGVASQAASPLFPESAAKRKILGNSSTAPRGIPEEDDVVYTAVFAYKQLYLTAGLYAFFVLLAVWGLQAWRKALVEQGEASDPSVTMDPMIS